MQDNFLCSLFGCELSRIDHHFGIARLLIWIRNTSKFFDNSSPRLGVETLAIAFFAYVHRCRKVHHNKSAYRLDHRAHVFASGVVRRNWSANCNPTILGDLGSDISDAMNVQVPMFPGKTEFGRKMLANEIAIQKRYRSATHFEKFSDQDTGDGRFTGAGEACEKDCETLFVPRWETAP